MQYTTIIITIIITTMIIITLSWTRVELATFDMTNQHSTTELPAKKHK